MSTDIETVERQKTKLKRPKRWAVVLHNDDITPMEFVVELLISVFKMKTDAAMELMIKVHTDGQGVAGVYPFEIAEQKFSESQLIIQLAAMTLKVTLEEE